MRPPTITLEQLDPLPVVYRLTIPPQYEDRMGHMNVRHYLTVYDEAGDAMYPLIGLTEDYFRESQAGGFDLEHHIHYLNEVRVGDTVAVRARILGRTAKRMHYMLFMVNETRGLLSSTFECVNTHADLRVRRTAPYPEAVAAKIDAWLSEHRRLDWPAPVTGVMGA